jgi:hypothetical protein
MSEKRQGPEQAATAGAQGPSPERPEQAATAGAQGPSPERRRALQVGITVGPVIMTVLSRPVFAQRECGSMGVMISVNNGTSLACTVSSVGYSPSVWQQSTSWPQPYVA